MLIMPHALDNSINEMVYGSAPFILALFTLDNQLTIKQIQIYAFFENQ